MDRQGKSNLQIRNRAAASMPPGMIGEAGWDILLALSAEDAAGLNLQKLAAVASVPRSVLGEWLGWLEDRKLVASSWHLQSDEFGAAITRAGHDLVENYLLATRGLQSGAWS